MAASASSSSSSRSCGSQLTHMRFDHLSAVAWCYGVHARAFPRNVVVRAECAGYLL